MACPEDVASQCGPAGTDVVREAGSRTGLSGSQAGSAAADSEGEAEGKSCVRRPDNLPRGRRLSRLIKKLTSRLQNDL